MTLRAALCSGIVVALAACSGTSASLTASPDGGGDAAAAVSADTAASDAANAYCARAAACAPAYITLTSGDLPTCAARFKLALLPTIGAAGSTETTAQIEACTQALPQLACSDLFSRNLPAVCRPVPGTLAAGLACGTDSQCVGARCRVGSNAICGTCGQLSAAGAACGVDDDCATGMKCVSAACVPYGAAGATCDAAHPCRPDLGCKAGQCATPSPAGTTCATSAECDQVNGVFCNPVTMKCEAVTFAAPNAACGYVGGHIVPCKGAATCAGAVAPSYQGTCSPPAADNGSCDLDGGTACNAGATCVGGTCKLPDPGSCH